MRHLKPPLTKDQLWQDGRPVRVRDIASICGMAQSTVLYDLNMGRLRGWKRTDARNAPWLITRQDAREYVSRMCGQHDAVDRSRLAG